MNFAECKAEAVRLTKLRIANYPDNSTTNFMLPKEQGGFLGYLGELVVAELFHFPKEAIYRLGSDGGVDFTFTTDGVKHTLDVKTAGREYGLFLSRTRAGRSADFILLASYVNNKFRFVGYATRDEMAKAPPRDIGKSNGVANPFLELSQLHPFRELYDLLARRER